VTERKEVSGLSRFKTQRIYKLSESTRFLSFQSGEFEKSVLLGYEPASQINWFLTFQTNVVPTGVLT
jgi:hypothetical protein